MRTHRAATADIKAASREAEITRSPARSRMVKLVQSAVMGGFAIEDKLWRALAKRKDNTLPDIQGRASLGTLQTLRMYDLSACTKHMFDVAKRVNDKGA
jgi:hypothetical protein